MNKLLKILFSISVLRPYFTSTQVAIIWGISGQDGIYLTQLLLQKGYTVHGVTRNKMSNHDKFQSYVKLMCKNLLHNLEIHEADIINYEQVKSLIENIQPDEIYNLAAQSNVAISLEEPSATIKTNLLGTLNILEAMRLLHPTKKAKFFQASSVEIFGKVDGSSYNEDTPLNPCSAYGESKLFAHRAVKLYRKSYHLFACNGILCNHESPLRSDSFVTKIVTKSVAQIYLGIINSFTIGNLNAKRDWGHAKDYVQAMWLMLQQETPEDFVIATGKVHSIRELIEEAFRNINITIGWRGQGINEVGFDINTNKILVEVNPKFFRPFEENLAIGDTQKAKSVLGWTPKVDFKELVNHMVTSDIEVTKRRLNKKPYWGI